MSSPTSHRLFVSCALGLDALLLSELQTLGFSGRTLEGGVEVRGDFAQLARICLGSRIAESVRVRLKEFEAREFSDLEKRMRALPFRAFLQPGSPVRVKVVCHQSKMWHSGAVKERAERVLTEHVGLVLSESDNAQVVHLRLDKDRVQVSLDATGERMHRRGARLLVEKASLRETLAAACVVAALSGDLTPPGQEGRDVILWDPFCGAGTIPLEALSYGHGHLPGIRRAHAFETWRNFDSVTFESEKEALTKAMAAAAPFPQMRAIASDVARGAVESTRANANAASIAPLLTCLHGDIEEVESRVPEGAFVVTNPPYGKRLQETGAMRKLLRLVERRPDLRPVVALVGGAARDAIPKERPALFRTKNGGVPVSARLLSGTRT